MAKIASVIVWGFESHTETQAQLAEGLTVITGPSDSGKTALLRAIRWVATGEPSGEEFLHTKRTPDGQVISQAEEVGVTLVMDDGREVTKTRRKGKTKYWVTGFQEPFEKAEVPEAVKEVLGIRSTVYGRDAQGKAELEFDLNFAYQLDPPFLISQPASAGAKVLGKLAGTEAIDQALKSVAKDTYAARSEKQAADKEYERKIMQLLDYTGLDEVKEQLDACDWLAQQAEADLAKKEGILAAQLLLDQATNRLQQATETLDRLAVLPSLEEDMREIEKAQQRYDTLLDHYERLGKVTDKVETIAQQIKEYTGLEPAAWLLSEAEAAADRRAKIEITLTAYNRSALLAINSRETIEKTKDLDRAAANLNGLALQILLGEDIRQAANRYADALAAQEQAQKNCDYLDKLPEAAALYTAAWEAEAQRTRIAHVLQQYLVKADAKERATRALAIAQDDIRRAELQLAAAWEDAGGICPLCEQPIGGAGHGH